MDFIDRLEQFLLRPRAKVYHGSEHYMESDKVFFTLGCERRNYCSQDKDVKKDGILSMMKKLRDNNYKHPTYTDFHLDLIGWEYFDDVLKLEPTNEDLFNLYTTVGYGIGNTITTFLSITTDKDWKLKYFKYGHDYRLDAHGSNQLKTFVYQLQVLNLSDDEWIDALSNYINNSIGLKEKEKQQELIEICIACIKNDIKCEKFIKDFFNEDVNLSNLFIESIVNQLKIDSKNIIKNFNYSNNEKVSSALYVLYVLLRANFKEIGNITGIDFYSNGTEYNYITYDDKENKGIEIIKLLVNEMMPILKDLDLREHMLKNIIKDLNAQFVKKLSYINLSRDIPTNEVKKKVVKV